MLLAQIVLPGCLVASVSAFGTLPSRSLLAPRRLSLAPSPRQRRGANIASLVAKRKGKGPGGPRVPGASGPPANLVQQQREYQDYLKMREQSGVPTFDLFVRGPNSPTWYPCGSLGGDDKSKQLVESWMGGLLFDMAKDALDKGVASSLYQDKAGFVARVVEQYPQLKKSKNNLKFGYKVAYAGLAEKRPQAAKVTELTEDMTKGVFDNLKKSFGFK